MLRERLIEMIQDATHGCAKNWVEVVADHLIENGVILPPVKVGQTIYVITEVSKTINKITLT